MPQKNPRALAQHAIRLLEDRIYKEYGLELVYGAEQEFTLVPRDNSYGSVESEPILYPDAYCDIVKSTSYRFKVAKEHPRRFFGFTGSLEDPQSFNYRTLLARDPFFPDDDSVAYSYREWKHQYEVVISHLGAHNKLPPDGSRAIGFAERIEQLRDKLGDTDRQYAHAPMHNEALKTITREWKPIFDSISSAGNQGLHICFSLQHKDNKEWLYSNDSQEFDKAIENGVGGMMYEGAYLLLADNQARDRLLEHKSCKDNNLYASTMDGDGTYIATEAPAANSDPYYATMLVLLGVYDMLKRGKCNPVTGMMEGCKDIPASKTEDNDNPDFKKLFFEGEYGTPRVKTILNELEPELGSKFYAAIRKSPPLKTAKISNALGS